MIKVKTKTIDLALMQNFNKKFVQSIICCATVKFILHF